MQRGIQDDHHRPVSSPGWPPASASTGCACGRAPTRLWPWPCSTSSCSEDLYDHDFVRQVGATASTSCARARGASWTPERAARGLHGSRPRTSWRAARTVRRRPTPAAIQWGRQARPDRPTATARPRAPSTSLWCHHGQRGQCPAATSSSTHTGPSTRTDLVPATWGWTTCMTARGAGEAPRRGRVTRMMSRAGYKLLSAHADSVLKAIADAASRILSAWCG